MFLLTLVFTSISLTTAKLPLGWKACRMSSPDFQKCLKNETQNAIQTLIHGESSLGFPSLEPYSVPSQVLQKSGGPVAITLNATDVHFIGVGKAVLTDLENQNWNKLILKIYYPEEVDMFANYFLSGKLLTIPLRTSGKLQFTTVNTTTIYEVHFKQEERDGKKYLRPKHVDVDFNPMKVLLKFDTSFKDNKVLEETLNRVANSNWKLILEELRPSLRKSNSVGVTAYLDNIFKHIPLEEFVIN